MIGFGTVILHKEQQYVFLFEEDGMWHCARILDPENRKALMKFAERPSERIGNASGILCFVILRTDQFKGEIAHLQNPASSAPQSPVIVASLGLEDKKALASKIKESESPLPRSLKKYVESLDL